MVFYSHGQVITVTGANANGTSSAEANDFLVPLGVNGPIDSDLKNCVLPNFIAGLWGNDYATICFLHAQESGNQPKNHKVSCYVGSRAFINGDNTSTVHIKWKNTGTTYANTDDHYAEVHTSLNINVNMSVTGLPNGTPVVVYWWYTVFGAGSTEHEDLPPNEDSIFVVNTMNINGDDQFDNNQFDFSSPNGLAGWNQWKNVTGTFKTTAGANFNFTVTSDIDLWLDVPPKPGNYGIDEDDGIFKGDIYFAVIPQYPVIVNNIEDMLTLFSVDIGSDAELSDPKQDGNEYFDPGDLYPKYTGAPLGMVVPWKDDSLIFGGDPAPDPAVPGNFAPVGSGMPPMLLQPIYFDLDGADLTELDLSNLAYGPGNPSIPWFYDSCVFISEYLFVSYDDDGAEHYASFFVPSAPVTSASPELGVIYSDASTMDEVNEFGFDDYPPSAKYYEAPIFSEAMVHANMQPDPLLIDDLDDDIDALDMITVNGNYSPCSQWYISVDHEAAYNHPSIPPPHILDPATIYQVTAAGPLPVITSLHHGLLDGTDIDAFEFAWCFDTLESRYGLALIFSVDDDDSLTLEDESGGLDSRQLYYSFLNGTHDIFATHYLWDDIDGLTVWAHSLNGATAFPNPVWGTKTWTGSKSIHWHYHLNWFPQGVPFDPEDVTVPAVSPLPVISTPGLDCNELNVEPGASVTVQPGVTFTVKGP